MAVALCGTALLLGAAKPSARQVYGQVWVKPAIELGPCLLSVALPASKKEHCIPWTRREAGGVAFHLPTATLVLGGSDGYVRGLDATNGKLRWKTPVDGALVSKPTLQGAWAYFGTDDAHVLKVDITSGRIKWDVEVDAEVLEPVTVDAGVVYVPTGLDSVYALSAMDGNARWVHKHLLPPGITLRGQARPVVIKVRGANGEEKRIVVGHADGTLAELEPQAGRVVQSVELGHKDAFNDVDADPVRMSNGLIAASQSTGIFALNPVDLAVLWTTPETGIDRLASAGPRWVVAAGAGKVLCLDARSGRIRWRFTFKKGAPTRVVVKGGRVHVASDRSSLYVLDLFDGRPLQYYGSGLGFAADLELSNDMLFAVSTAGSVHALSNAFGGKLQRKQ